MIRVRDAILHHKFDEFQFDREGNRANYPRFLQVLADRGVLGDTGKYIATPWITALATRAAGTSAVNAACGIVLSILDAVPANDPFRGLLHDRFQPISSAPCEDAPLAPQRSGVRRFGTVSAHLFRFAPSEA